MRALCTEAALHALRRRYPQIYTSSDKLQLDVTSIDISAADFRHAMTKIVPAGQRAVLSPGRPLSAVIRPLFTRQLGLLLDLLSSTFPYLDAPQKSGVYYLSVSIAVILQSVPNNNFYLWLFSYFIMSISVCLFCQLLVLLFSILDSMLNSLLDVVVDTPTSVTECSKGKKKAKRSIDAQIVPFLDFSM